MELAGTLEGRQAYTIHGQPYSRLFYTLPDDPETIHQCQLPDDAVDPDLRPGDPIVLTMLLRTVMEIRRDPGRASGDANS
jgi:hypothetical protein